MAAISAVFMILAIIGIRRKDRPEFYGTGEVQKITFKDYWDVLKHNRAIQMLVVSASSNEAFIINANKSNCVRDDVWHNRREL